MQEQQERRLAAAANQPKDNAEQQFLAWYEGLTPAQRTLYDQGKGRKPDKATAGAVSTANPLGLNERQIAALSTQENATLNYAANLTGLGRFEIDRIYAAEGPEGVSRVMNEKGKRLVQGPLANAIEAVPFVGSRIVDIANSDLVAPREAGASGIAMFQNPTGMITGPDIASGRAQSPQAIYPLSTQAQIAQQTLEAVRQGRPGQASGGTEFATEADAEAAADAGALPPGTRVVIGGVLGDLAVMPFIPDAQAAPIAPTTRGRFVPDVQREQGAPVEQAQTGRPFGEELGRQLGLTGRYAVEGLLGLPATLANAPGMLANAGLAGADYAAQQFGREVPFRFPEQNAAVSNALSTIGLPEPETAGERVIGDASRFLAGTGGIVKGAEALAPRLTGATQKVVDTLQRARAAQATSAVGAGTAVGATREAGGGPLAQLAAGVAGGLAGPSVAGLATRPAGAVANLARRARPMAVEDTLRTELKNAGIDWEELGRDVQAALIADTRKAIYAGQPLDPAALRRLTDYRTVRATPMIGDITQDVNQITYGRNLSKQMANSQMMGGPDLPGLQNANAKRVIETLEGIEPRPTLDTFGTGQKIIERTTAFDEGLRAQEKGLYGQARDTLGREIPLDRQGFVNEAFDNLARINKGAFLPADVRRTLNQISRGEVTMGGKPYPVPFDVDAIDSLKTTLSNAMQRGDGNTRMAIGAVRRALDNVSPAPTKRATGSTYPITEDMATRLRAQDAAGAGLSGEALAAFDRARAFARGRFSWQESAPFIEDALGGATPDKFVKRHVIEGDVDHLAKLGDFIRKDPELYQAVRKQIVEAIKARGGVDKDHTLFTSKGMEDGLKAIGDRKLQMFFEPYEIRQIKAAVAVGRHMQAQPIGSAVNNSNSGAMVAGKLTDVFLRGLKRVPIVRETVLGRQAKNITTPANAFRAPPPPRPTPLNQLLLTGIEASRRREQGP